MPELYKQDATEKSYKMNSEMQFLKVKEVVKPCDQQ